MLHRSGILPLLEQQHGAALQRLGFAGSVTSSAKQPLRARILLVRLLERIQLERHVAACQSDARHQAGS